MLLFWNKAQFYLDALPDNQELAQYVDWLCWRRDLRKIRRLHRLAPPPRWHLQRGEKGEGLLKNRRDGEGAPRRPWSSRPRLQVQLSSAAQRAAELRAPLRIRRRDAAANFWDHGCEGWAWPRQCECLLEKMLGAFHWAVRAVVCVFVCVCVCVCVSEWVRERGAVQREKEGDWATQRCWRPRQSWARDWEQHWSRRRATQDLLGEPSKCEHGVCHGSCRQDATFAVYSKLEQGFSWEFL